MVDNFLNLKFFFTNEEKNYFYAKNGFKFTFGNFNYFKKNQILVNLRPWIARPK